MVYVIQVLSAILIGIAIGALLGARPAARLVGSLAAIVLAILTIVTGSWMLLAVGVAIFLAAMLVPAGSTARA